MNYSSNYISYLIVNFQAGKHWIFKPSIYTNSMIHQSVAFVGFKGRWDGQPCLCISIQNIHQLLFFYGTYETGELQNADFNHYDIKTTLLHALLQNIHNNLVPFQREWLFTQRAYINSRKILFKNIFRESTSVFQVSKVWQRSSEKTATGY